VLFFKRQWPIIIAFVMGILMWARFYVPTAESQTLQDEFVRWDRIIAGFASLLGILSLLHYHMSKIRLKRAGFGFSYVTILAFFIMALAGFMPWPVPGFAEAHTSGDGFHMWMYKYMFSPMQATMFSILAFYIASAAFRAFRARSFEATALLITACVMMIGRVPIGELISQHTQVGLKRPIVAVDVQASQFSVAGQHTADLDPGTKFQIEGSPGNNGEYTVASSTFAENITKVVTAIGPPDPNPGGYALVGLPILNFPKWTEWLLNIPNAAAQRGILLGVILSQIAICVRIIFGIERTYMGGGD
jgi:hypothetical protein